MEVKLMRKKVISSFVLLILSISLFVFSSYAYFTDLYTESFSGEIGFVDVDLNVYFDDGASGQIPAEEVVIEYSDTAIDVSFTNLTSTISSTIIDLAVFSAGDEITISGSTSNDGTYTILGTPTTNALVVVETLIGESAGASVTINGEVTKPGVYSINILSNDSPSFFEDFRLTIDVNSNVDTYLRIKIYEQLTLIYTDYQGKITELSILYDEAEDLKFNYNLTNWYDNRIYDNYMYYKVAEQRVSISEPTSIALISSYFASETFGEYPPGYSLQIAFSIEAVQSDGGPLNVWGLQNPPWDTEINW